MVTEPMSEFSKSNFEGKVVPNFFLCGAPKCGTTALAEFLQIHDEFFLPTAKETFFWSEAYNYVRSGPSLAAYKNFEVACWEEYLARHFSIGSKCYRYVGDASTDTLYFHERSIPRLQQFVGHDARMLVLVREPLEAIVSRYQHNVARGWEDLSILDAVEEWPSRSTAGWSFDFDYFGQFDYPRQIESIDESFQNVVLVNANEMFAKPAVVLTQVLDCYGLSLSVAGFGKVSPTGSVGSLLSRVPGGGRMKDFLYKKLTRATFVRLRNSYRNISSKIISETPNTLVSEQEKNQLCKSSAMARLVEGYQSLWRARFRVAHKIGFV